VVRKTRYNARMTEPSPPPDNAPGDASAQPFPPPADSLPKPPTLPKNVLLYAVAFIHVFALLVVSALYFVGLTPGSSFLYLLGAMGLGALASLFWLYIEKQRKRPLEEISFFAWIAFPLAMLLFFGQMPLVAIAIYPSITEFFEPHEPVQAYYVRRGDQLCLDISFPLEMKEEGNNVRLGDTVITAEFLVEHSELFQWPNSRVYSMRILEIEKQLGLPETTSVSINSDSQEVARSRIAVAFRYAGGERVQPITVDASGHEVRRRALKRATHQDLGSP